MAALALDLDAPGMTLSGQLDQARALWQPHGPLPTSCPHSADEEIEGQGVVLSSL